MSRATAACAALLLLAAAGPARAAMVTRAMLIRACTAHEPQHLNDCAGYIAGVADMTDSVARGVCIPEGIEFATLRQRVTKWLQAHTTSNGPAAPAVVAALRGLYPCNR